MITMSVPLKLIGLQVFFLSIFSRSSSGFSAFRSWKSPIASGSIEHRVAALLIWSLLISGELDLALRRLLCEGGPTSGSTGGRSGNSSGEEKEERLSEE